ncbi:hypothetical protein [Falsiroseomonas sp. CW058]|uniref:hypothetical protein n=1 Tax=Falsiroseomonas sp. CW058 TaxID=3388664 RepID=UPI003D3214A5
MGAPIQTDFDDVVAAVAEVRRRGVQVGYLNGRVVGLAAVRKAAGGDAGRVRSMVVLLLDREGYRIPPTEIRLANTILDTEKMAKRAARRATRGADRRMAAVLEGIVDRLQGIAGNRHGPHGHAVPEGGALAGARPPVPGRSQKAPPTPVQPAGLADGEVRYGTTQKPNAAVSGGLLAQIRAGRNIAIPGNETFDPYDLNAVERRRAGEPLQGTDDDDDPLFSF